VLAVKSFIRIIVSALLYYSGTIYLYRFFQNLISKDHGIKILAYHDIADKSFLYYDVPPQVFLDHVKYLIDHGYNIVSLRDAIELLSVNNNNPIPKDTVVITFDDVYKSFYSTVFPVVKKFGIPVAIFISTQPIDLRQSLFIDTLIYVIESTSLKKIDLTTQGLGEYHLYSSHLCAHSLRRKRAEIQTHPTKCELVETKRDFP